jgi:hypothetical protein
LIVAFVAAAGVGLIAQQSLSTTGRDACAIRDGAFLPNEALANLRPAVDTGVFTVLPLVGRTDEMARAFEDGRLRGWVTDLVWEGEYRAENESIAPLVDPGASFAPFLPLKGAIVTDHPEALLEVYDTNLAFRSEGAALAWYTQLRSDPIAEYHVAYGGVPLPAPSFLQESATSFTAITPQGADPATNERSVEVVDLVGRYIVQVTARGGAQLSASSVSRLMQIAAHATESTCGASG